MQIPKDRFGKKEEMRGQRGGSLGGFPVGQACGLEEGPRNRSVPEGRATRTKMERSGDMGLVGAVNSTGVNVANLHSNVQCKQSNVAFPLFFRPTPVRKD